MRPCRGFGTPAIERPVDLARRARAEGLRERRRGKARLGDEQAAGRVLVEPVHEARALAVHARLAQHLQHAVEVARGARAALHRQAHRLVEHQHVVVLVQRDRLEEIARLLVLGGETRCPLRHIELERRDAHLLARPRAGPWCRRACRSTRTSPLRMMRWMWLNERPGNRASKKRSTRMPASSAPTVTVCTPVATSGAEPAPASRRLDARGGRASKCARVLDAVRTALARRSCGDRRAIARFASVEIALRPAAALDPARHCAERGPTCERGFSSRRPSDPFGLRFSE